MKHADDIANLFRQFGAESDPYHELSRKQEHKLSNERWPLVSALQCTKADEVPSVDRSASAAVAPIAPQVQAHVSARPEPFVQAQRAAAVSAELPRPVTAPAAAPVAAASAVADGLPPAALRTSRSPLAGLARLRGHSAPTATEEHSVNPDSMSVDLPSVFARLAGAPVTGGAAPAPVWQPRKGHP